MISVESLFSGIRTIIFDLGGVLYNVEYHIVEDEFAALAANHSSNNNTTTLIRYTRQTQPELFSRYEVGAISSEEFCEGLRTEFGLDADNTTLIKAWNAMLLGVYPGRNALVWRLKQKYKLALLSNTNEIHIRHVEPECRDLFSLFDKLFYSFELGARKPDAAIFRRVLDDMSSEPSETLFIDDSFQHIEAARALGIHTLWLQHPDGLELAVDMLTQENQRNNDV